MNVFSYLVLLFFYKHKHYNRSFDRRSLRMLCKCSAYLSPAQKLSLAQKTSWNIALCIFSKTYGITFNKVLSTCSIWIFPSFEGWDEFWTQFDRSCLGFWHFRKENLFCRALVSQSKIAKGLSIKFVIKANCAVSFTNKRRRSNLERLFC